MLLPSVFDSWLQPSWNSKPHVAHLASGLAGAQPPPLVWMYRAWPHGGHLILPWSSSVELLEELVSICFTSLLASAAVTRADASSNIVGSESRPTTLRPS